MRSRWIHNLLTRLIADRARGLAGLAVVLAAASAGLVASRADAPPFVPPAGWSSVRPPGGLLGLWVHTGDEDFQQNMVLGRERTQLGTSDYDARTVKQLRGALQDFQLGANQPTTTCGGRPAHYMAYTGTLNGQRIMYEHMVTFVSGYAWFVIYARLEAQPSLPEAREALTTLCGLNAVPGVRPAPQPYPQPLESRALEPGPAITQGTYVR